MTINYSQIGQDIDGKVAGDFSGESVSLSANGKIIAIGAHLNDNNGVNSGHVRVFEWDGTNWVQVGQDIDGEAPGDSSGVSVSLSANGNIVAIGANENDGNGNFSGHVRVFNWNGTDWIKVGQDIDGKANFDFSGTSVSL